jgi:hypothetical protein
MEMQQMMKRLLAKMDTNPAEMIANQAKTDTDLREMREEIMAGLETMIQSNQEETDANLKEIRAGQELLKEEMLAKLEAHHKRMMTRMDSQL